MIGSWSTGTVRITRDFAGSGTTTRFGRWSRVCGCSSHLEGIMLTLDVPARSVIPLAHSLDALRGWFNAHVNRARVIAIQSAT
jgi:hypothetical protein